MRGKRPVELREKLINERAKQFISDLEEYRKKILIDEIAKRNTKNNDNTNS